MIPKPPEGPADTAMESAGPLGLGGLNASLPGVDTPGWINPALRAKISP